MVNVGQCRYKYTLDPMGIEKDGTSPRGNENNGPLHLEPRCRTAKSSCVEQLSPTDVFGGGEDRRKNTR